MRTYATHLDELDVTVSYHFTPGEEQTRDHPGADPVVEIIHVEAGGGRINDPESYLANHVLERWEREILEHEIECASDQADARADAINESRYDHDLLDAA